jgi:hypothetical protein
VDGCGLERDRPRTPAPGRLRRRGGDGTSDAVGAQRGGVQRPAAGRDALRRPRQELLAQAYIERLVELDAELRARLSRGGLATVLGKLSGPLTQLRTDFAVRFEFEGAPARGVRPETWQAMRIAFRQLIATVYALVAAAARRDGVELVSGTFAERIVWSALATGASERNADVFGHSNASYFRFLAGALSAALAAK